MFTWIAGLGLKAVAGKALGNAASGLAAVGRWLGSLNAYQLGCIALGVLLLVDHVGLVMAHRHSAKLQAQLTSAGRQLELERGNNATLEAAIGRQNAAVKALATETVRQQAAAAKASQAAQERAGRAEATSAGLAASSRSSEREAQPCAPSKALEEAWK